MNSNRRTYVKRKIYLSLLKKIKAQCTQLGVEIKIYNRPLIWKRYGYSPNFGEQSGNYCVSKKMIIARFFGKIGYAKKLELLLHELRHAIHHNQGLYADYYKEKWENMALVISSGDKSLPCRKTARLAEMDCNRFAYYWLKKEGILIPKEFKYKGKTFADEIHYITFHSVRSLKITL